MRLIVFRTAADKLELADQNTAAQFKTAFWRGDRTMNRNRFTEEQVVTILREPKAAEKTADVWRKHANSGSTFHERKAKYGALCASQAGKLKVREDENAGPIGYWRTRCSKMRPSKKWRQNF
jgi:putative transposase